MRFQVVGLNHTNSPLDIREKVSLPPDLLAEAYDDAHGLVHHQGLVIVSTCHRTEIYVAGAVPLGDVLAWWERVVGVDRGDFSDYLYWYQDDQAVSHLLRVATGLDSMVLGETQILGQIKDAYQIAHGLGKAGRLHRIFDYALRTGKRAHSETGISHNALSMGHAVVELARNVFGDMHNLTALVMGTGDMGTLVARYLASAGLGRLLVTNRTRSKAVALAEKLGGQVIEFGSLEEALRQSDIIVSSTSARGLVLSYEMARSAWRGQGQRLRFLFDMAVPRDIDPRIMSLGAGLFLYDVDDVKTIVRANLAQRQREVTKVERIIREEQDDLTEELGASRVGPVIQRLREKAELIRQTELDKALHRLPNLSEAERTVISETTRLILNKFLNDAMVSMRQWGGDDAKTSYIDAIRDLFQLEDGTTGEFGRDLAVEGE
ncbi:MAG: glutamyl-tRNA reductase [Thermaerobacter sp.]|nr:glutamyl-tRNA reductase [Thermaerobacter sp.]